MTTTRTKRVWQAEQRASMFGITFLALALAGVILAGPLSAVVAPERSDLRDKEFRIPELDIETTFLTPAELAASGVMQAAADLTALRTPIDAGKIDARSGRWAAITPVEPLVPGAGFGNALRWESLGFAEPADDAALATSIGQAFRRYLVANAAALRINVGEIQGLGRVTTHEGGRVAHIFHQRVVDGVPVRGSYLNAVVNSGNLVLLGTEKWGDIDVSTQASVSSEIAWDVVRSHVQPYSIDGPTDKSELIVLPLAGDDRTGKKSDRDRYTYRLAHVIRPTFAGDLGSWEALVDAHSGELLSFRDTNQYAEVKGGVLPVSNDGVSPDGVEQPGWPMPFQDISTTLGTLTTDTGGNVAATGSMTATFFGPYVNINDNCGAESLTQSNGIDWGASAGTDCVTPGFGGAGNTHASRTGFYELNKIIEMARGQLPSNSWLQSRLTSNMNINNTCNAFWNGTVNFYRSGGGCANTGELAGVFDHEWGHGMDANDATPGIASPSGEGIADIYTALRLNNSCIGRNFLLGSNCSGNGDPCLNCDGVRDIDYLKRASGNPHDYSWSNANCGGSVHCVGGVYSEAVWSLWKRKLPTLYGYDNNTAQEIVTRLTFIGAGATGTWFSGGPPNGGCGGSSGYMNYLAADDDNGNLNDGTPHMTAIYQAFNDQEIACQTPAVQDSGCAGTPTVAPVVNASTGNQQIGLSWGAVAGASSYEVFRTEGVFACDFGKVKIASTTGTSFNDSGLQNGRDYSYVVIPKGPANSCFGPASSCTTAQPVGQPDFTVSCSPSSLAISQGDNDTTTCTVISSFGYTGNVGLSCSGNPAGVSCAFAPSSVSPPANGSANSTLTLTVSGGQATGTFAFDVVANDGAINRTAGVSVQVIPAGSNGPQIAVYDSGLGAPKCAVAGSSCDSTTLVDGRANLGPEPNQPNTLDSCADGTSGSYHNDESNDRIVVSTLDGGNFTEGDTVEIAATVYAWSTGSSDSLDLYWAADANSPTWNLINSTVTPTGGTQTLTAQYVLPAGSMQAVRAQFRYQSTNASCAAGAYNDRDDLVFTVEGTTPNTPPVVTITAPAGGSSSTQGDSVSFTGTATDTEDGTISANLSWTSSLDGSIGSGASFSTTTLSAGTHTITASVTDSGGLSGSDAISFTVNATPNTPPMVTITAPADGSSSIEGASVSFAGTATDAEDGPISANLTWASSLDGGIGTGASFSTTLLSVGTHTITASVTDSNNASASDSISVIVNPNQIPVVVISAPGDGSSVDEGTSISFAGSASDPEDGDVSTSLAWSSSLDGAIGSGPSFAAILSVGTHTITATATDSLGATNSDSITVTVNPNTPPNVSISAPTDGSTFTNDDVVSFSGTASDAQDGDLSAGLSWTSDLDGAIGSGASFSLSTLSLGIHTITASVADSLGLTGSDSINVTIESAGGTPVTVTFTSLGSEDGWVRESSENSGVGGKNNSSGTGSRPIRTGDDKKDKQWRSILSFDTSSIPAGATITEVKVRVRRGQVRGTNPFGTHGDFLADIMNGAFGSNAALQNSDFEAAATASGAAVLSNASQNGDFSEGTLDAAGLAAINGAGRTQVRLRFSLDDNDDRGEDTLNFYSGDHSNAANHPQLVVTYLP